MSAFPTFRLPFLAAKDVVNHMDLGGDLTALFLCSKKTREFVKSLRKSVSFAALSLEQKENLNFLEIIELLREDRAARKIIKQHVRQFEINISNDIGFKITVRFNEPDWRKYSFFHIYVKRTDQQDQCKGIKRTRRIGDMDVPVVMTNKYVIHTFWDSKQKGFEKIGEYLKDTSSIFNLGIAVNRELRFSEDLRLVLNWMNSKNHQFPKHCTVHTPTPNDKINGDDFKFILDNVHPLEQFNIYARLGDEFLYNTKNFKSDYLYISHANWFTLKNLFMTECETIRLSESKLTNNDLNEYLKQWIAGNFSKLKNLYVEMKEDLNIDIILSGLEDSSIVTRRNDSVSVERNNGFEANIFTRGSTSKTFEMNISRNHSRS